MLGDTSLDDDAVAMLRGLIVDSGALVHTEQLIAQKSGDAFAALERLGIDTVFRRALHLLAEAAVTRNA